jgi:hypothetical protein
MTMRIHPLLIFAVVLVSGCDRPKTATVSGIVNLDGKPLANAAVSFQPMGEQLYPGPGSTGRTDDKGEYSLQMIGGGKGAIVGKHRVEISCPVDDRKSNPDEDRTSKPRDRVAIQYNVQSTLTFEVKPGPNTANFDVTSK